MKSLLSLRGLCLVGCLVVLSSCQTVSTPEAADPIEAAPAEAISENFQDTPRADAESQPEPQVEPVNDAKAANKLFDEGIDAYEANDLEVAAEKLEAAIAQGVTSHDLDQAHTILGNVYTDLDEFEKAIEQHKAALQINPDNHQAWVNMGVAYRLMGDYDAAEKAYLEALNLAPDYPELYASLGALFVVKGEPEKALEHLEHAAELDSNIPVTFANLALAYAMVDRFDDAEKSLKRAIVLGYENGDVVKARIQEFQEAQ